MQASLKRVRGASSCRPAVVCERNAKGVVKQRILDVLDVEGRKADAKEIMIVNDETEQEILRTLRRYRNTVCYIAVVVTLIALKLMYDNIHSHGIFGYYPF